MSVVFLCHLSCVLSIHCRCTIGFLILLHTSLYHIFLLVILPFSIFWYYWSLFLLRYFLKFTPAFRFFMAKVVTDWAFHFISKKRKAIIKTFLDPCHIYLISCFFSHDIFVRNTLGSFVSKIMTWETLTIKEVPAIIESTNLMIVAEVPSTDLLIDIPWRKLSVVYLRFIVVSVYSWSKLSLIHLVIYFMPLLTIVELFISLCFITIDFSGGWWLLWLRCFFKVSKTWLYKRRALHFDNLI